MTQEFPQVAAFRTRLQKSGDDFICSSPLPCTSAFVSFLGPFQGQVVLWNMTLATLKHLRSLAAVATPATDGAILLRSFIEIHQGNDGVLELAVGLDLEIIDEPVIKKTIIMIRNYKRLVIGKIEFGNLAT